MARAAFLPLETSRLRLRHFVDADLSAFMAYRNDPAVTRYQTWQGFSEAEAFAFIQGQKTLQPGLPGHGLQIAIELKETGTLIGDCFFIIYNRDHQQAEIGYSLSPTYQERGLATEAVACVITHAFLTFDLHRITAVTDCENTASAALLERLGMRREGHFLQNIWLKGKWGDEYLYATLKEEWLHKQHSRERRSSAEV